MFGGTLLAALESFAPIFITWYWLFNVREPFALSPIFTKIFWASSLSPISIKTVSRPIVIEPDRSLDASKLLAKISLSDWKMSKLPVIFMFPDNSKIILFFWSNKLGKKVYCILPLPKLPELSEVSLLSSYLSVPTPIIIDRLSVIWTPRKFLVGPTKRSSTPLVFKIRVGTFRQLLRFVHVSEYKNVPLSPTATALLLSNIKALFKLTSPILFKILMDKSLQSIPFVEIEIKLSPPAITLLSSNAKTLLYANDVIPGPTFPELMVRW